MFTKLQTFYEMALNNWLFLAKPVNTVCTKEINIFHYLNPFD